jgi:hypothetical protein
MTELPEYVYLVTVDSEWPISALTDDHPTVPEAVEREVERRRRSENVTHASQVHVYRVRLGDAVEMELLPGRTVKPSLRVRDG